MMLLRKSYSYAIKYYYLYCTPLYIFILFIGEKQAAVHHDQWNAARTNHHGKLNKLYITLVSFLLLRNWFINSP